MATRLGAVVACGVAVLMSASVAFGQIKRTVLQQADVSIPGKEVITARADIPVGSSAGMHTHPGDEISYVLDGALEVVVEGLDAPLRVRARPAASQTPRREVAIVVDLAEVLVFAAPGA